MTRLSSCVVATFVALIFAMSAGATIITINFDVLLAAKIIDPFTGAEDPSFSPHAISVSVRLDNMRDRVEHYTDAASIYFGTPELTSPLTSTLRYGPTDVSDYASTSTLISTFDYSPSIRGTHVTLSASNSKNDTERYLWNYNWAFVSPTMDPSYPPLLNTDAFNTLELMSMLYSLQDDQRTFYFAEVSYRQDLLTNTYPYEEWYIGHATINSIQDADTPEPGTRFLVGPLLLGLIVVAWRTGDARR